MFNEYTSSKPDGVVDFLCDIVSGKYTFEKLKEKEEALLFKLILSNTALDLLKNFAANKK